MSPGLLVRRLLGPRLARLAGRRYRALFVDLEAVAGELGKAIPTNAAVLDVGGGDGDPLNRLLARRNDIHVTTLDVAPGVGRWIEARYLDRVTCLESTTLQSYLASGRPLPDVVLISDVMHHVPVAERDSFLSTVAEVLRRAPEARIIIKDVEPGHWRATLGRWSDLYVTGDRNVQLISRDELICAMRRAHDGIRHRETALFVSDPPNYAVVFSIAEPGVRPVRRWTSAASA